MGENCEMVWDMLQKPPSERHLWRGFRDGRDPGPVEIATRVLSALKRYERKWPEGQELLQLRWVVAELAVLVPGNNRELTPEETYRGWKRIEKAALAISSLALPIDFKLSHWAEDLVYKAANRAEQSLKSLPYTHSCSFCWRTAQRRVRGWPFCKDHLPDRPDGRRLRYLAKQLGKGDLKRGIVEYRHRLVEIQQRIGSSNRGESETFNLEEATALDGGVKNPWWRQGSGVRELFGPDFLYIRYKATIELWSEFKTSKSMRNREAAGKGGRPAKWTNDQYNQAIKMLEDEVSLRRIERQTTIPRSTLSTIKTRLSKLSGTERHRFSKRR